jgi:hypothetical protein
MKLGFENSSTRPYGGLSAYSRIESDMTNASKSSDIETDFLRLARTALTGRTQDVHVILRRAAKRYHGAAPHLADATHTNQRSVAA